MSRRTRQGSTKVPNSRESGAEGLGLTSHNVTIHQYSQLQNESSLDQGCSIYFVIPRGQNENNCSPRLIEAFNLCITHNITCKWINEVEVLKLAPAQNNVFVLDQFVGPAFEYFLEFFQQKEQSDFLIIGPQVLKYVFIREEPELVHRGYPMFTLSMKNMVICLSGFRDQLVKEELMKNIKLMGGMVSVQFSMATTHLIAFNTLTEKCFIAYEKKLPVMKAEWVDEVFKDGLNSIVHATDPMYSKFEIPIFYKLVFCFSQISGGQKTALKNIIEQNGGTVHADLRKRETNILVVPKPGGDKYRHARSWKLPIITPEWVIACKEAGHVVNFTEFSVSGECVILSSTPEADRITTGKNVDITTIAYATSVVDQSIAASIASQRVSQPIRKASVGNYLDGCKVYISGNPNSMDEARKYINASGAMRLDHLSDAVTHVVVVGDKLSEQDEKAINKLSQRPYIVGMDWLIESVQKCEKADEEIFVFVSSRNRNSDHNRRSVEKLPLDELNSRVEFAYADEFAFPQPMHPPPTHLPRFTMGENDDTRATTNEMTQPEQDSMIPLFQGKNFLVELGDDADETNQMDLYNLITDLAGEVVDTKSKRIDYVISSILYSKKELSKYDRLYTEEWLNDCLEERCIQRNIKFYHLPLLRFNGSNSILQDIVLAISAYSAAEKEYVSVISKELGAIVQDVFSRKGKKRGSELVLQTTHLICNNTENEKYKAAIKWNVPVVHAEWIIDCFKSKSYLDPIKYFVREGEDGSFHAENITMTPKTDLPRSRLSKDPLESAKSLHASMNRRTITPKMGTASSSGSSTSNNPTPTITPISAGNMKPVETVEVASPNVELASQHVEPETEIDEIPAPSEYQKVETEEAEVPSEIVPPRRSVPNLEAFSVNVNTPPGPSCSTPKGPYVTPSASRRHLSLESSEFVFTPNSHSQTPGRAPSPSPESPAVKLEYLEGYYQLLLNESFPSPGPIREKLSVFTVPPSETAKAEAEMWKTIHRNFPLTPESEAFRLKIEKMKTDRFNMLNGKGPIRFDLTPEKSDQDPVSERSGLDDTTDNSDSEKDIKNGNLSKIPPAKSDSNKRSSDSLSDDEESTIQEAKKTRITRSSKEKRNGGVEAQAAAAGSSKRKL